MNKIKKIIITLGLTLIFVSPVYAKNINLKIDGVVQNLDLDSIILEENLLVDVNKLSKALGATMKYTNDSNTVTITKDKKTIVANAESKDIKVNGADLKMPVQAKKVNGQIYVPARFISERLDAKVSWVAKSNTIVITTTKKAAGILNLEEGVTVDTKVYNYKKGLEYAIAESTDLKNLEDSRKILDENLKDAKDMETSARNLNDRKSEITAKRLVKKINFQKENLEENEKTIKNSIESMYRTYFTNIISLGIDKQTLLENIELEKINVRNITLKHQLGYESDFNLNQAKEKLKQIEAQSSSMDISIKNAKETLNLYLGFSSFIDIYINYDIKYSKVSTNINAHIATKNADDPKLKMQYSDIDYARYVKETTEEDMNESRAQLDNDILTLERKYDDTVLAYEKSMRVMLNNLMKLEQSRSIIEIDLNLAKEAYNKAVANFEAGLITMYEVQGAKISLLKYESDLLKNQLDYDNMKFTYDRPYLQ